MRRSEPLNLATPATSIKAQEPNAALKQHFQLNLKRAAKKKNDEAALEILTRINVNLKQTNQPQTATAPSRTRMPPLLNESREIGGDNYSPVAKIGTDKPVISNFDLFE